MSLARDCFITSRTHVRLNYAFQNNRTLHTPYHKRMNYMDPFSSTHVFKEPMFERLGGEMEHKFTQRSIRGVVESLPKAPYRRPPVDFAPFRDAANVHGERQMYGPLVSFPSHTPESKVLNSCAPVHGYAAFPCPRFATG